MATEIRAFTLTVPPGTLANAPAKLPVVFPVRVVEGVEFVVPDGPNGLLGFALYQSGVALIPFGSDPWIVTSGEKMAYAIEEYPDTGVFELRAYNTGTVPHSVTVRFLLRRLGLTVGRAVPMLDDIALMSDDDSLSSGDTETVDQ